MAERRARSCGPYDLYDSYDPYNLYYPYYPYDPHDPYHSPPPYLRWECTMWRTLGAVCIVGDVGVVRVVGIVWSSRSCWDRRDRMGRMDSSYDPIRSLRLGIAWSRRDSNYAPGM